MAVSGPGHPVSLAAAAVAFFGLSFSFCLVFLIFAAFWEGNPPTSLRVGVSFFLRLF